MSRRGGTGPATPARGLGFCQAVREGLSRNSAPQRDRVGQEGVGLRCFPALRTFLGPPGLNMERQRSAEPRRARGPSFSSSTVAKASRPRCVTTGSLVAQPGALVGVVGEPVRLRRAVRSACCRRGPRSSGPACRDTGEDELGHGHRRAADLLCKLPMPVRRGPGGSGGLSRCRPCAVAGTRSGRRHVPRPTVQHVRNRFSIGVSWRPARPRVMVSMGRGSQWASTSSIRSIATSGRTSSARVRATCGSRHR